MSSAFVARSSWWPQVKAVGEGVDRPLGTWLLPKATVKAQGLPCRGGRVRPRQALERAMVPRDKPDQGDGEDRQRPTIPGQGAEENQANDDD